MPNPTFDRRQLLQSGGLTIALAALVAACGGDSAEEEAPGRVGYAPPATPLPTVETNDIVYLRTATSIEQTLVETYGQIAESGVLDGDDAAMLERLDRGPPSCGRSDGGSDDRRRRRAVRVRQLVVHRARRDADARADRRRRVQGHPAERRPDARFAVVVNGMESMVGAMYQQMVELVTYPSCAPS